MSWGGHSMITPNGRFATSKRICMSMSDCMYLTFMYRLYVSSILLLFYIHCYQILDNLSGCTLCIGFIVRSMGFSSEIDRDGNWSIISTTL